jgi:hypothetical protein
MAQRGISAKIDLVELEKLCAMQATDEEIGAFFNVSARTILRRKKVQKFADVMERGRAKGRLSMRRMQMKLLEAGNATMGVWLGKQYLGQADYPEPQLNVPLRFICIPKAGQVFEPSYRQICPAEGSEDAEAVAEEEPDKTAHLDWRASALKKY